MRKFKKILFIVGSVLGILVIGYFMLPDYAQKALIYLKPGIEDYPIFENRTVDAGVGQEWPIDPLANQLKIDDETMSKIEEYEPIAFLIIKDGKIRRRGNNEGGWEAMEFWLGGGKIKLMAGLFINISSLYSKLD